MPAATVAPSEQQQPAPPAAKADEDTHSNDSGSEDEGDLLNELWPRETQSELHYEVWGL